MAGEQRVGLLDADIHGPDVGVMRGARRRGGAPGEVMLPIVATEPESAAAVAFMAARRFMERLEAITQPPA